MLHILVHLRTTCSPCAHTAYFSTSGLLSIRKKDLNHNQHKTNQCYKQALVPDPLNLVCDYIIKQVLPQQIFIELVPLKPNTTHLLTVNHGEFRMYTQ